MTQTSATLIGFHDQGNLGLGYLASTLSVNGFPVQVLDFRQGEDAILESVRSTKPVLVGFSLIFQYYLPQFARLASHLRTHGIDAHFCAGGHYPSLRYRHLLETVPALDSVVRCEGELTLLELMTRLASDAEWREVAGIACRDGDECVATPPRPLIADLDDLPYPERSLESLTVLGRNASPVLASRGCARACSFCSIRQFYAQASGKPVRVRDPGAVVREMEDLHDKRDVSIFLFQDDDFPLLRRVDGHRWIDRFLEALQSSEIFGRVIWKISCRADEVEPELFSRMRDAGLYMVYLGLESGTPAGLQVLNKQLKLEDNLQAVETVRDLRLAMAYGFMLFDPTSTFESVRANVAFLRQIGADGSLPVVFCRMLPYAGTPIEEQLEREGRLKGDPINPDYDFTDHRLGDYFEALNGSLIDCVQGSEAVSNELGWAWQEYWVIERLFPPLDGQDVYEESLRALTKKSNAFILDLVEESSRDFEKGVLSLSSAGEIADASRAVVGPMRSERDAFIIRNQEVLLSALGEGAPA